MVSGFLTSCTESVTNIDGIWMKQVNLTCGYDTATSHEWYIVDDNENPVDLVVWANTTSSEEGRQYQHRTTIDVDKGTLTISDVNWNDTNFFKCWSYNDPSPIPAPQNVYKVSIYGKEAFGILFFKPLCMT